MRFFTCGLNVALLSFCFLGLSGCAEDNEAAVNDQAAKSKESDIPPDQVVKPISSMEEYRKRNPGFNVGATSSGHKAPTPKPAPDAEKK